MCSVFQVVDIRFFELNQLTNFDDFMLPFWLKRVDPCRPCLAFGSWAELAAAAAAMQWWAGMKPDARRLMARWVRWVSQYFDKTVRT